jgi:hypothetical protein
VCGGRLELLLQEIPSLRHSLECLSRPGDMALVGMQLQCQVLVALFHGLQGNGPCTATHALYAATNASRRVEKMRWLADAAAGAASILGSLVLDVHSMSANLSTRARPSRCERPAAAQAAEEDGVSAARSSGRVGVRT